MTEQQTVIYDYCRDYLKCLEGYKKQIPFGIQKYGCGTGVPSIEHTLDNIHRNMYEDVIASIYKCECKVKDIIKNL